MRLERLFRSLAWVVPVLALAALVAAARGPAQPGDADHDGIADAADNCPAAYNPDQNNFDRDSLGSRCDATPVEASRHLVIVYLRGADRGPVAGASAGACVVARLGSGEQFNRCSIDPESLRNRPFSVFLLTADVPRLEVSVTGPGYCGTPETAATSKRRTKSSVTVRVTGIRRTFVVQFRGGTFTAIDPCEGLVVQPPEAAPSEPAASRTFRDTFKKRGSKSRSVDLRSSTTTVQGTARWRPVKRASVDLAVSLTSANGQAVVRTIAKKVPKGRKIAVTTALVQRAP